MSGYKYIIYPLINKKITDLAEIISINYKKINKIKRRFKKDIARIQRATKYNHNDY